MTEFEALGFLYSRVEVKPSDIPDYYEAMKVMTNLVRRYTEKATMEEVERSEQGV